MSDADDWAETVEDLAGRRERARAMGGEERLAEHRAAGKLDARARVEAPLVMLLEGAGYRATGSGHGRSPTDLLAQAQCSGRVPIVTGVMGASAGHGALIAPMS